MRESSRWLSPLSALLAIFAACLPQAGVAEVNSFSPQARAVQAFRDSAEVAELIDKARTRRRYQDVSEGDAPVAIKLSESCGVAGCYYSYLVSQLLSQGQVVNAQSTSVSAVVKISPSGHTEVTIADLTGIR